MLCNEDCAEINLTVSPLSGVPQAIATYLVVIEENVQVLAHAVATELELSATPDAKRIAALQRDLLRKEHYLRAANEELETANEELRSSIEEMQSVNEELQSTNEELETSKEELRSVNEELATVNAKL